MSSLPKKKTKSKNKNTPSTSSRSSTRRTPAVKETTPAPVKTIEVSGQAGRSTPASSSGGESHKRRRRKCRLSRAFQRDEREVLALLENASPRTEASTPTTATSREGEQHSLYDDFAETQSLEFFAEPSVEELRRKPNKKESGKTKSKSQRQTDEDWLRHKEQNAGSEDESDGDYDDAEDKDVLTQSIAGTGRSAAVGSSQPNNESQVGGSTYIQIEEALTSDQNQIVLLHGQRERHHYEDAALLYTPKAMHGPELALQMAKVKARPKSWNEEAIVLAVKRLPPFSRAIFQRHLLEAQFAQKKLSAEFVETFLQRYTQVDLQSSTLSGNRYRYRTFCIGTHVFHPVFCAATPATDGVEIPTRRIIKLHLKELRFTAHPMLMEEHRLANALDDEFDGYAQRQQEQRCERLQAQLAIERRVLQQRLQAAAASSAADGGDNNQQQASVLAEQAELVRELRTRLYAEETESRRQLQRLLDAWLELKQLRKRQQFQCTRFKLRVHLSDAPTTTEGTDLRRKTSSARRATAHAQALWSERYETDLQEICREEWEQYYRDKRLWREQKKLSKSRNSSPTQNDITLERPLRPDLQQLSSVLRERLAHCLPSPNEPQNVRLLRVSDEECFTLPPVGDPIAGFTARKRFLMKIYFDREFVGVTRTYRMEPDFRVAINEAIGIVLDRRLPKEIRIALYEKTKMATTQKVANLIMSLTGELDLETGKAGDKLPLRIIQFSSSKQLGVEGRLYLRFHSEEEKSTSDTEHTIEDRPIVMRSLISNLSAGDFKGGTPLKNHPSQDIADEDNDDSIADEHIAEQSTPGDTCTFEETLLQFCSNDELKQSRRFALLRARYAADNSAAHNLRFIPALEHELPDEIDLAEQQEDSALMAPRLIDMGNWADPIDVHKHAGKKRVLAIYEAVRCHCRRLRRLHENTQNLLLGDEPQAGWGIVFQALAATLLTLLFYFFKPQPRRPLNPIRLGTGSGTIEVTDCPSDSPLVAVSNRQRGAFSVRLHVVRATGIPVRSHHLAGGASTGTNDSDQASQQRDSNYGFGSLLTPGLKYSNVRPFVALSWRDRICRTTTVDGSSPTWNEHIMLQLSNNALEDLRDDIRISLYDEVIITTEASQQRHSPLSSDDGAIARIQTNWLGEYRVPLANLVAQAQTMEGVTELYTPQILIGYRRPAIDDGLMTASGDTAITIGDSYPEIKDSVHLWFYLSCEPRLPSPLSAGVNSSCLDCAETSEVREQLLQWTLQVRELRPQRYIQPLVCTAEGRRICLTRLLEALPLPRDVEAFVDGGFEAVCRFVSLLSVIRLKAMEEADCQGWQGVWLNNQLLLDTTWGSPKDLGVLLCNFLLGLGVTCWLVLGVGSPYGETAFVLYAGDESSGTASGGVGEFMLIDPVTGKRYAAKDVFCPLQRIHYIVSPDNIYCNIQRESRVSLSNLNVHDSACWLAAFNKRQPAPVGGHQKLDYAYSGSYSTSELRKAIERKVMKKITAWRTMRKTIWNRAFQPRLHAILEQLERSVIEGRFNYTASVTGEAESKYTAQLSAEFPQYKFYGFTLNFAYTNLTAIAERLKATGLHLISDERVEYSIAVHVHSYTQNVLSIWLFLLSITPNNT